MQHPANPVNSCSVIPQFQRLIAVALQVSLVVLDKLISAVEHKVSLAVEHKGNLVVVHKGNMAVVHKGNMAVVHKGNLAVEHKGNIAVEHKDNMVRQLSSLSTLALCELKAQATSGNMHRHCRLHD